MSRAPEWLRSFTSCLCVGVTCGVGSAIFLHALEFATAFRIEHEVLVYALPAAGLSIGALYERWGAKIERGTDLVIDTLEEGGPTLPARMGPMVVLGTVLTHLFGGSAGREGTAVQLGASLGDAWAKRLGVDQALRRRLLVAGVAGGFGSVFGTPLAGAVFALEFTRRGRIAMDSLLPAAVASIIGDQVTRALWVEHSRYPQLDAVPLSPSVAIRWIAFAVAIAGVGAIFIELTHSIKRMGKTYLPRLPLRMFVAGTSVFALWRATGTSAYLGLGIPTILSAFEVPLPYHAFGWKLLFTSLTVGGGFLGGEVTPLFFAGATLGNALGQTLALPLDMAAGVGMAAMFGCAARTPLALSIMAVELFGAAVLPHIVLVLVVANALLGGRSLYRAQRDQNAAQGSASNSASF